VTAPTADPARLAAARRRLLAFGVVVLHEDHLLLGVGKAAGVLSQPGPAGEPSLVEAIDAYRQEAEGKTGHAFVGLVHRLDRNVSGAMIVGKSSKAASRLSEAFRRRAGVEKRYLAWVARAPAHDRATLKSVLVRDYVRRVTRAHDVADDEGVDDATPRSTTGGGARPRRRAARVRPHGADAQVRAQLAREAARWRPVRRRAAAARPPPTAPPTVPVGGAPLVTAPVPDDRGAWMRRSDSFARG
jgi:23S rRNA pseudouridine1911/1915/1917 synthase